MFELVAGQRAELVGRQFHVQRRAQPVGERHQGAVRAAGFGRGCAVVLVAKEFGHALVNFVQRGVGPLLLGAAMIDKHLANFLALLRLQVL